MKDPKEMTTVELFALGAHTAVCLSQQPVLPVALLHANALEELLRREQRELSTFELTTEWAAIGAEVNQLWHDVVGEEEAEVETQTFRVSSDADLEKLPEDLRPMAAAAFAKLAAKLAGDPATTASAGSVDQTVEYLRSVVSSDIEAVMALEMLVGHIEELGKGAQVPGSLELVKAETVSCEASCCKDPLEVHVSVDGDGILISHGQHAFAPAKLPDNVRIYRLVAQADS